MSGQSVVLGPMAYPRSPCKVPGLGEGQPLLHSTLHVAMHIKHYYVFIVPYHTGWTEGTCHACMGKGAQCYLQGLFMCPSNT